MMAAQAAAALVAGLLAVLVVAHGVRAQPANDTSSAVRQLLGSGGGWLPAKATWYGAPNGAGPDDNGMYTRCCCCRVYKLVSHACHPSNAVADIVLCVRFCFCRWRVWVQGHQPVPLHVHDVVRQRAPVPGRPGLRCMLRGNHC
jgi:hypothetical protein